MLPLEASSRRVISVGGSSAARLVSTFGAKHSPPTCRQGGPSGIFGGSSCDRFFSTSTQSFPHPKPLQKQKLLIRKGFRP